MQMPETHVAEVDRLRQLSRDLVAISTLPAIWGDLHPEGVVKSLSNVLLNMLHLDLVYIRIKGNDKNDLIETMCSKHGFAEPFLPQVRAALDSIRTECEANQLATIPDPFGKGALRVALTQFGIAEDDGIVIVGSRQDEFPAESDRLVLSVAVNQAAAVVQRQRSKQVLQRSERRFLDLADAAPAILWVTEMDGSCSFLSQEWYEFTGQRRDEGLGFGWIAAIHPEDREAAHKAFLDANEQERQFTLEHRLLHADGSYHWVIDMGRPRFSPDGDFLGFVGNVIDIDHRKQVEEALHVTQSRLSAVFEILPVGLGVVDISGKLVLLNQEMQRYLPTGVQPSLDDNRHGRWRGYHEDGRPFLREDFPGARALRGEQVVPGVEMLYTQDDGIEMWTQVAAVPIRSDGGGLAGQVAVVTNIDAFKRTEAALRLSEEKYRTLFNEMAQSNKHLSDFLAVLAHELRNPLAPIITGLEMMRIRPDHPETVSRVRDMMERQANQMIHLLNDLLDIARVTNGKIELKKAPTDLNSIISSAVEASLPAMESARHELSVKFEDRPLRLNVDATRITQVIANLLTNAAKYTPQGGKIMLLVERDEGEAVISVVDNGIGIPPESISTVFDMFSQVGRNTDHSPGGLGIGLALVRNLVTLHGGAVSAVSEGTGKGSTFIVRLSIDSSIANIDDEASTLILNAAGQRVFRILVADDNVDAAQSLASLLKVYGHEIEIAQDGREALEIANKFRPEIVFLDLGMPGMTGYEVARQLRKTEDLGHIRIVAVTGWGTDEDWAKSREAGFDDHYTKPLSPATIFKVIKDMK